MAVDIIAGARPNFMKIAPIVKAMRSRGMAFRLVHTGQHYDQRMSGAFFQDLGIPDPDVNLGVGSGSQAEQTARIMLGYDAVLREKMSRLCLVVGDVTSTMACALVAKKLHLTVAHVEAGIRSGDRTMAEEINRIVTDVVADDFFTTSERAGANLQKQGAALDRIHFVGNTMIDTLLANQSRFRPPSIWKELGLVNGEYFVVTLHRPANVDETEGLVTLMRGIAAGARGLPIIFPVHPRTAKVLGSADPSLSHIHFLDPLGYLEFNYLVQHAKAVITDSGGITEETTVLGVPCLTLRDSTERPETVEIGTNEILGTDPRALSPAFERLFSGSWKKGARPPLWDGKTGPRIVDGIERILAR